MTVRTVSSETARTQWRHLLDLTSRGEADVIIERHGKATAVLIRYEDYEALRPALAELRTGGSAQERGRRMAAALEELARLPERAPITDPACWQREQRAERTLPGREQTD